MSTPHGLPVAPYRPGGASHDHWTIETPARPCPWLFGASHDHLDHRDPVRACPLAIRCVPRPNPPTAGPDMFDMCVASTDLPPRRSMEGQPVGSLFDMVATCT